LNPKFAIALPLCVRELRVRGTSAFLDDGVYDPDAMQIRAVEDSIAFFDKHLMSP
jgi:hypothetical protein